MTSFCVSNMNMSTWTNYKLPNTMRKTWFPSTIKCGFFLIKCRYYWGRKNEQQSTSFQTQSCLIWPNINVTWDMVLMEQNIKLTYLLFILISSMSWWNDKENLIFNFFLEKTEIHLSVTKFSPTISAVHFFLYHFC